MEQRKDTQSAAGLAVVTVWDWPVRLVHWLLVALVATSWITSEIGGNAMTYHMWSGYTILALVLFRIVWGFVGSTHARFGSFVRGPGAVMRYAAELAAAGSARYLGHNPLGGWSVLLMLALLLLQASTGLFANDEIATEGPLASHVSGDTSSLLTTIHRYNFYVLLTLICLHLAAVLYYLLVKRQNLIGPMITGRKHVQPAVAQPSSASSWLALALLVAAGGVVALIVNSA
jgi:cytochrome b